MDCDSVEDHIEDLLTQDLVNVAVQNDDEIDEDLVEKEASLPAKKVAEAWVKAIGGIKEAGKVYGLGSHSTTIVGSSGGVYHSAPCPPTQVPPTGQNFTGTPTFEEAIARAVNERVSAHGREVDEKVSRAMASVSDEVTEMRAK